MATLPHANDINVAAFSQLFASTTNSYKLIFFKAILNKLKESNLAINHNEMVTFTFNDLAEEMVALCWYPQQFFHLSFGIQDQTNAVLDKLVFDPNKIVVTNPNTYKELRKAIKQQFNDINAIELLTYVPYRLLSPFFSAELRGQKDAVKNSLTAQLADTHFDSVKPLYKISTIKNNKFISIHPDWLQYIYSNLAIVEYWCDFSLVLYLQKRNPNTPAISSKIQPPLKRISLSKQQKSWQIALSNKPTYCIYTGDKFSATDKTVYALDHYMPWSLVAHDQLWNLIPVTSSANSSKSNHIPHHYYIDKMIEQQFHLVTQTKLVFSSLQWQKSMVDHATDLRLSFDELQNPNSFERALHSTLTSLTATGTQMGFGANWLYNRRE
ncbi:HNH endonuclease domain-containing protein [Moritella sp. Urea-trap-13]|uniref:HNH endonuclease domain-containing protein n=1 Tax=Moritella sp. Urea-trap-13 TaxID=2058327 RepID=UPI000C34F1CD|nr:HNH endonuclease domain-containing protein [Moritella sp. Urea-trap-13]PKH07037.1 hypothetical protein CXF93_14270 [Moritella sp. Urea-trap-13]